MKTITKYLLISGFILLATAVITGLFYIRVIYRSLVSGQESKFPPFIARIIDKIGNQEPKTPKIIPAAEDTIQILEGWTLRDIGRYFETLGKWPRQEFEEAAGLPLVDYRKEKKLTPPKDLSGKYSFLADKPKYYGLEGYLYPDTYRIYASSTAAEVIDKMLDNFDKKLTPKLRADIKAQGKTIYSVITMASIIEKEAPLDYQNNDNRDARIISGIFWGRLKIGQALQSDATLSYILNDNQPGHKGKDLEVDSAYNTYKYRGLPPGPICNPGILAIEAAVYPIETDYNYFLTPQGKDTVIYSKTYEEHLKNVYKYLR